MLRKNNQSASKRLNPTPAPQRTDRFLQSSRSKSGIIHIQFLQNQQKPRSSTEPD